MDNEKIVEIYNTLLDSLEDKRYLDIIWYKCIKRNAYFDNIIKFYFFRKGIEEGYYPLTAFTKNNTDDPKILEEWNVFKDELNKILPLPRIPKPSRPSEYIVDLCWLSKDGYTMPLCMELEQNPNLAEIIYDFKKLLFINSSLKIMIFFNYSAFNRLLELLKKNPYSNPEETFLLISVDTDQHHVIGYIDYHVRGCLFSKNQSENALGSDTEWLDFRQFSIHITSSNCVENIKTNYIE